MDKDGTNPDGKKFKLSRESSRIIMDIVAERRERLKQNQESQPDIRDDAEREADQKEERAQ